MALHQLHSGMQLVRIEEDGAYVGLVGGSPRPRKGVAEQIAALPLELDSRDARFVTELVSGTAYSKPCTFIWHAVILSRRCCHSDPLLHMHIHPRRGQSQF